MFTSSSTQNYRNDQKTRLTAYMDGMSPMPGPLERESRRLKRLSGMSCLATMMPLEQKCLGSRLLDENRSKQCEEMEAHVWHMTIWSGTGWTKNISSHGRAGFWRGWLENISCILTYIHTYGICASSLLRKGNIPLGNGIFGKKGDNQQLAVDMVSFALNKNQTIF